MPQNQTLCRVSISTLTNPANAIPVESFKGVKGKVVKPVVYKGIDVNKPNAVEDRAAP